MRSGCCRALATGRKEKSAKTAKPEPKVIVLAEKLARSSTARGRRRTAGWARPRRRAWGSDTLAESASTGARIKLSEARADARRYSILRVATARNPGRHYS